MRSLEYFSFCTDAKVAKRTGKAILVAMRNAPEGLTVIQVLSITLTTLKQLEYSGAPWRDPGQLPENVKWMIRDYDELHMMETLKRMWEAEESMFSPHSQGKIQ